MARVRELALLIALPIASLSGCQPQVDPTPTPTRSEAPPPSEPPSKPETPPTKPETPTVEPGDRAARRQAALALLTDGQSAESLTITATAPGEKFDRHLDEKLTPKVWVSDRPRSQSVAKVEHGSAKVKGPLDQDLVRRIVRAHINEVRFCYTKGLTDNPKLAGSVTVDFRILATGRVGSSSVAKSTVSDTTVGNCIAKAVRRWMFPKPRGGGEVDVSYPFVLKPR